MGIGQLNPFGDDFLGSGGSISELPRNVSDGLKSDTEYLERYGRRAGDFGEEGRTQFDDLGGELGARRKRLEDIASGRVSLSDEQLRQGLQQQLSAQRSLAAGARPGNQALAARTAAVQMGRAQSGMSGQAALAGIQERNAANQALLNALLQQRQQALQAGLGGYGLAVQSGGSLAGTPTGNQILAGGIQGLGDAYIRSQTGAG